MTKDNAINELIKNGDFENEAEFFEELENRRKEVVDFLNWRANGGRFKKEELTSEYDEACISLLGTI